MMDCLFFPHLKISFPKNRLFSPTSESWFSYESWWYTLRCTQIARRMVWNVHILFSLRPVFTAQLRQCECFCRSDLELAGRGGGRGGRGIWKLCVPLEKSWLHPYIVLYSSPVNTFIPSKSQQTEKSGEGFEFSLGKNYMGLNHWNNGMFMKITRKSKLRFPYRRLK